MLFFIELCRPLFQSSPAYKGGRFATSKVISAANRAFQSSPAYKGGRFQKRKARRTRMHETFQSSPAYKGGRFARGRAGYSSPGRFNPRPPIKAGASHSVMYVVGP